MGKTAKKAAAAVVAEDEMATDAAAPEGVEAEGAAAVSEEDDYERKVRFVSKIANPLASRKLTKRVLKTVRKAAKAKQVRRGVKEVVKALRKKETGLVVLAGDISPIDVITHVPILCEEAGVPYVYVPSKEDLGLAGATKRPTSCIMVTPKADADFKEAYDEVYSAVAALPVPV